MTESSSAAGAQPNAPAPHPQAYQAVKAQKLPAEADKANDPDKWRDDVIDDSEVPF